MSDGEAPISGSRFGHSGFFVLRTPLLPFEELMRWSDSLTVPQVFSSDNMAFVTGETVTTDAATLRERLVQLVDRPAVNHALYLSSPAMHAAIPSWKRDPLNRAGQRMDRTLSRYLARMTGRATPFGLFSGCSVGNISTHDADHGVKLEAISQYYSYTQLDLGYLSSLVSGLIASLGQVAYFRFRVNSSLYRLGKSAYYLDSTADAGGDCSLIELRLDPVLKAILERAADSAIVPELVEAALSIQVFERDDLVEYIRDLVHANILVPTCVPPATGQNATLSVASQLGEVEETKQISHHLHSVYEAFRIVDAEGVGADPSVYKSIAAGLSVIAPPSDSSYVFHVDMYKPLTEGTLPPIVADELLSAAEFLMAAGFQTPRLNNDLYQFCERFAERYGTSWVRLVDVIDEETGIGVQQTHGGHASSLLEDLRHHMPLRTGNEFTKAHACLMQELLRCHPTSSSDELVIDSLAFPIEPINTWDFPDAFSLTGTIVAPSIEAVRNGRFKVILRSGDGPSGATMLGRFCGGAPELIKVVKDHLAREEAVRPNAIYAEIAYLPPGRLGNVTFRPVLRQYEIEYLGRSGAKPGNRIPIADLLLTVTERGEILLYSERLGKQILPRFTCALDFSSPNFPPLLRFLCRLQYHPAYTIPSFSWGPLDSLDFLPRVRRGRAILALARWRLNEAEVNRFVNASLAIVLREISLVRRERGIPRWVHFADGDTLLPIDLENVLSISSLRHLLMRNPTAILQELYPTEDDLCIQGPEGRFQHEVIIPYTRQSSGIVDNMALTNNKVQETAHFARDCPPGSEWLYIKVYGGAVNLETILVDNLPFLLGQMSEYITEWFFVRYTDPDLHIRLRIKGDAGVLLREVYPFMQPVLADLLKAKRISKLQLDTYRREVERYGGPSGIGITEQLFRADSEAAIALLREFSGHKDGEECRWQAALYGVHRLMLDWGCSLSDRRELMRRAKGALYRIVLSSSPDLASAVSQRYRDQRRAIACIVNRGLQGNAPVSDDVYRIFDERSYAMLAGIGELKSLWELGKISKSSDELMLSYVHMSLNRLLRQEVDLTEYMVYEFLNRYYTEEMACSGLAI